MSLFISFMAGGILGIAIMCMLAISKDQSDDTNPNN